MPRTLRERIPALQEKGDTFDVLVEYLALTLSRGKTLVLVDPMLATGSW